MAQVLDAHLANAVVGQSASLLHSTHVPPEGLLHNVVPEKRVHCSESVQGTQTFAEHLAADLEGQSESTTHCTQVPVAPGSLHTGVPAKCVH